MSLVSILHTKERISTSRVSDNPTRMASYSAWLLEVLKAKCRDFSMRMWLGPSRTISIFTPLD